MKPSRVTFSTVQIVFVMQSLFMLLTCMLVSPAHGQDGNEPNDSFTQATSVSLDAALQGIINPNNDVDYFVVETPRPGALIARLNPVPAGLRIDMYIFNSDQQQMQRVVSGTGQLVEAAAVLEAGANYVVLSRYDGQSTEPYTLTLTLDPNEFNEVNDGFAKASPILLDAPTNGTIRPNNDVDYFVVETPRPGALIARLNPVPAGLQMRMRVFNSDQQQVQNVVSGTGQLVEAAAVLEAGANYVVLSRYDGQSTEPYTLTLTLDPNEFNEVNDAFTQAKLIGPYTPIQGTIRPNEDLDYFKFEMTGQGEITAVLEVVPVGLQMRMRVFNSDQQQVENVVSGIGQRIETTASLGTGTSYIVLSRYNGTSREPYTLLLQGGNIGTPTSVESTDETPMTLILHQNHPNPFNPATRITFALPVAAKVTLRVFDLAGKEVATLAEQEPRAAGEHEVRFDARHLPSGVYLYRLQAGDFVQTRKMLLVR